MRKHAISHKTTKKNDDDIRKQEFLLRRHLNTFKKILKYISVFVVRFFNYFLAMSDQIMQFGSCENDGGRKDV